VPCFDESAALPYLARTLHAFAESQRGRLELHHVFIDDGSRDDTAARLHTLARELPNSRVVQHPHNRGIAAALLTGFAASRTELVAVLDADCTFDPAQLPAMLALLTDGVDVVSASPAHAQGSMANVPRWRAALSVGAAALYRHVLRQRLSSCTSCFRLYRRRVLPGLTLSDPGFCGVAEILCRLDMAGARIVEYPARLETRVLGRSKIRVLRTVASHLRLLARLLAHRWWRRPLPTRVQAWQPSAG
jgi:glycosyltransferase involved in cell wall biosynthesis